MIAEVQGSVQSEMLTHALACADQASEATMRRDMSLRDTEVTELKVIATSAEAVGMFSSH